MRHKLKRWLALGLPRDYWLRALGLTLALRVLFLVLVYFTDRVLLEKQTYFWDFMLNDRLVHWDAHHYLYLAKHGYTATGDKNVLIAFFPLYPWLVRGLAFVVQHYLMAAVLVSWVASVVATALFQGMLAAEEFSEEIIARATVFFVFFPMSIYAALPYTEALFMMFVFACLLAARRKFFLWACVWGGLACLTRSNGILLLPALMWELWQVRKNTRWYHWLALSLVPAGIGGYLALNYHVFGDAFRFLAVQQEHWHQARVWPTQQILFVWNHIMEDTHNKSRAIFYEFRLVGMVVGTALLAWSVRLRLRTSWQIFSWGCWVLYMATLQAISFPRYVYTLFPIYVVLARWSKTPTLYGALVAICALLQAGWFIIFAAGKGAL